MGHRIRERPFHPFRGAGGKTSSQWYDQGKLDGSNPTLWADFFNNRYAAVNAEVALSDIITVTRASSGTGVVNGNIVNFGVNVPRLVTGGILREPQGTNLIQNANIVVNQGVALTPQSDPLGGAGWEMRCLAANTVHGASSNTATSTANTIYTISAVVKNGSGIQYVQLTPASAWISSGLSGFCNYDLTGAGAVTFQGAGVIRSGIIPLANGDYRVWFTFSSPASTTTSQAIFLNAISSPMAARFQSWSAVGTEVLNIWGLQCERSDKLTSLIPTTTAAVTRAADDFLMNNSNIVPFSSWFNPVANTVFFDGETDVFTAPNQYAWYIGDGSTSNREAMWYFTDTPSILITSGGSSSYSPPNGSAQTVGRQKFAAAAELNNFRAAYNNNLFSLDTIGDMPLLPDRCILGAKQDQLNEWNGIIKEFRHYPIRGLDASIQALTADDINILSAYDLNFVKDTYKGGTVTFTGSGLATDVFKYAGLWFNGGHTEQADGSVILKPSNNSRRTDLGLWVEQPRTNVVLWSRDLTNAAWVKTNMTALKTTAGLDNVVNSASSITATAVDATILQPITLVSSQRFQSAYVKRLSGAGAISMTMDGGATWIDISSQVTASWTRISLTTALMANPHIGFKVAVSGDSFAIDFVQNENGNTISSPRQTAGTSVNSFGDRSTAEDASGKLSPLPPLLRGAFGFFMAMSAARLETCGPLVSSAGVQVRLLADGSFRVEGPSTNGVQTPAGQFIRGKNVINKIAAYISPAGVCSLCCNGNAVVSGSTGLGPALTHMDLGTNGSQGQAIHGTIKRVAFFNPGILTDADLVNFTKL